MLLEIQIAVSFLTSYLYNKLPRRRVDLFSVELTKQLKEKFEGHWYLQRPSKGSGYRCLLIGDELDPVLMNAANNSGVSLEEIRSSLPDKLTMWIDPDEVSYRIGKHLVYILAFYLSFVCGSSQSFSFCYFIHRSKALSVFQFETTSNSLEIFSLYYFIPCCICLRAAKPWSQSETNIVFTSQDYIKHTLHFGSISFQSHLYGLNIFCWLLSSISQTSCDHFCYLVKIVKVERS